MSKSTRAVLDNNGVRRKSMMEKWLAVLVLAFIFLIASSCGNKVLQPVVGGKKKIKTELKYRSFRQFDPSKDASQRRELFCASRMAFACGHNMPKAIER